MSVGIRGAWTFLEEPSGESRSSSGSWKVSSSASSSLSSSSVENSGSWPWRRPLDSSGSFPTILEVGMAEEEGAGSRDEIVVVG